MENLDTRGKRSIWAAPSDLRYELRGVRLTVAGSKPGATVSVNSTASAARGRRVTGGLLADGNR
ncbi:MAG: hypothetical protein SFV15_06085 [Polyangiaceae bacterium]|nr:hypothetical protein [Polyangiaceae bacterium]